MADVQLGLDLVLVLLLGMTLFHAVRLDRALRTLKRDRAALDGLLNGFESTTRQAEAGLDRLRGATETTAAQMARQSQVAQALHDDLSFLTERGERLADRLDSLVRAAMPLAAEPPRGADAAPDRRAPTDLVAPSAEARRVRSQAERDLLQALRSPR
jgi:hypothetical protein